MASTNETGHARTVANLETLISFCTNYGTAYNPSNSEIQLATLNTLLTQSRAAIDDVVQKNVAFRNTANARRLLFQDLKPLATKLINALSVTQATAKTIQDAKAINKKIQGTRVAKKEAVNDPNAPITAGEEKTISTSQQSYDQLCEHFNLLITLLKNEPTYAPNEVGLQIVTLTTMLDNMRTANTNTINAFTNISTSRINRNTILYNENTGLCTAASDVKKYIKSVFGATSAQYKQVSKLAFRAVG